MKNMSSCSSSNNTFACLRRKKKFKNRPNMEHVKSKGTNLQNKKTFKDLKHKEHKTKPNNQSPANP